MSTSVPSSNPIFLSDNNETIKNKIFGVKKVGAGTLDELFEKGADLNSDTLIQLARLYESNRDVLSLIETGYSNGFIDFDEKTEMDLISLLPPKGIVSRNNKIMITTFGIRCYLTNLIIKICSKYVTR